MIELIDTGLVYRNPRPTLKSIHAWHPSLVLLDQGDLLATFDLAEAIAAPDYSTYIARSTDSGVTWSEPVRLFEEVIDRPAVHSVRISKLADGTLVGVGQRRYCNHPDIGGWNPETYGVDEGDWFLLRSQDGAVWSGPEVFAGAITGQPYELCHAIVETGDGRWLLPTGLLRTWEGAAPHGLKTLALVSEDKGRTWEQSIDLFEDADGELIYHEVSLIELPDGPLLSVAWPFNAAAGRTQVPVPYALAADGRQFTRRGSTGIAGETTKMLGLGDNRVLCLSRCTDRPGLWAVLARIEGDQWVNVAETPMWQGSNSRMAGDRDAATELADLHFGFPNMVRLPKGEVLAAFWCREDCIHNIRWLRIGVE